VAAGKSLRGRAPPRDYFTPSFFDIKPDGFVIFK
jgi:hypothetical protein